MGVKERPVDYREFEKLLKELGFFIERQNGTSHTQWEHPNFRGKRRLVTVSRHNSPYVKSVLKSMREQAGLSKKELFNCLVNDKYLQKIIKNHTVSESSAS